MTKIIRLPEVIQRTGLSRSTIYMRISNQSFPDSINLGGRAVGWIENEVDEWIEKRIQLSRELKIN